MGKQYLNGVLYGTGEIIKFSPNIYSEEEKEVGVWCDGRPLYQKTCVFTGSFDSSTSPTVGNLNVSFDSFKTIHVLLKDNTNIYKGISFAHPTSSNNFGIFIRQNGDVEMRGASTAGTFTEVIVTVQGTKTTDTPWSGKYTSDGTMAHHYSTTEKVIGTWVDNKPLYERVFVFENSLSVQSSWTLTNIDSTNIRDVVNVIGIHEDGTCYNILCADPTQSNHTKIGLMAYRATSITQIKKVILQYTKTTD